MKRLNAIIATCLLALWLPATSLCLMENAGLLAKNDGCCEDQSSEKLPCCVLASAVYKMDDSRSETWTQPSQLLAVFVNLTAFDSSLDHLAGIVECGVSPPELSTTWQFSYRAAPAPRAPSSAS